MIISSTRFGNIEAEESHIVHFRDGLVGFPSLKSYVLVEWPSMPLVLWMQSTQNPQIAFPLVDPLVLRTHYKVSYTSADLASLNVKDLKHSRTFVILTIPADVSKMTVNLKAPIVFNTENSLGTQVILQDKSIEVRIPIYTAFENAMNRFADTQGAGESAESDNWEEESTRWNVINIRARGETPPQSNGTAIQSDL